MRKVRKNFDDEEIKTVGMNRKILKRKSAGNLWITNKIILKKPTATDDGFDNEDVEKSILSVAENRFAEIAIPQLEKSCED